MEFIVPQFIEREAKIVGPFNFKQFIFLAIAGGLTLFLFFVIKSLWLFLMIAFVLIGSALALVFLKLGGTSLPDALKNLFIFLTKPKIYLWKRKSLPPKMMSFRREAPPPKEESKETLGLKIADKSQLNKLSTFLETKERK